MTELQFFRDIPTGYELNGPVLSFLKEPYVDDINTVGTIAVSPPTPGGISTISLDVNDLSFDDFATGTIYTLTPNKDVAIKLTLNGASGGGVTGGKGGNVTGTLVLEEGKSYQLVVGLQGSVNGITGAGGGGAAYQGGNSGGGYTGIFVNSISQANSILIAGGGGGAAENDYRFGGNGGGLSGQDADDAKGGTQSSGGNGTYSTGFGGLYTYMTGSALQGGRTVNYEYEVNQGGGGGGGYFGGGSGRGDENFTPGPFGGAGGSGFIHPTLVTNGAFGNSTNIGGGRVSLEFVQSQIINSITLVGIATATFPSQTPANPALNSGSVVYQWYENGFGALSDNINIVGSATTSLEIKNIKNPQDAERQFYLEVDYSPAGATPNANNEILRSGLVSLPLPPYIILNTQPESFNTVIDSPATFTVDAQISDSTYGGLSYQWRVDGQNLSDGSYSVSSNRLTGSTLAMPLLDINNDGIVDSTEISDVSPSRKTITHILNGSPVSYITASQNAAYFDPINTTSSYLSITPVSDFAFGTGDFTIECWVNFAETGFRDIFSTGTYGRNQVSFRKNQTSQLISSPGSEQLELYYNGTIVASGGTFALGRWYHVAATRQSGIVRLFIDGVTVAIGTLNDSVSANDCRIGSTAGNEYRMSGMIQDFAIYNNSAKYTSTFAPPQRSTLFASRTYTVSGSRTNSLSITPKSIGYNKIDVVISNPNTSRVISNSADLYAAQARSIVTIESYDSTSTAKLTSIDLDKTNLTITSDQYDSDTICLYASEKDIDIELDLYGAKGTDNSGYLGGEGGFSKVSFTMKKNVEYILRGIKSNSALYLYQKASLIAAVGEGGKAGPGGNGGAGGGVNIAGQSGSGTNAGRGGSLITSGSLPANGIFGSTSNPSLIYPEDSANTGRLGGRTISCSKGVYWRNQGFSSCQDVGTSKFRLSDGTIVSNSASIDRGFKEGYSINQTAGRGLSNLGANGGNGATGGDGGDRGGGGGGSGYTNGFPTIISTQVGGSTGNARVNVRLTLGDFYVDNAGRILILSNTDNRDPRTLTKTTGKVLPNTNTCIDDIRWQRFLDLSRDGTRDYRLTATLNNSTVRVTNATSRNIYRMLNSNALTLRNSLTGWVDSGYAYQLLALAWDETSGDGMNGYGGDYSILSWSPTSAYGFGYYGSSTNSFFSITTYSHFSANYWILPPGVPDFP